MVILPLYWYTCIYCQNIVQMYCTAKYQQIIALHWCSMENYEKEVKDNTMNHNSDYLNVHWQARGCKLITIFMVSKDWNTFEVVIYVLAMFTAGL